MHRWQVKIMCGSVSEHCFKLLIAMTISGHANDRYSEPRGKH
jgi:hypothetical protein